MDNIKSWAFSICAASILVSILNMLVPEGSLQRTYKIVLCVFILCIIASPFSEINLSDFEKIFNSEISATEEEFEENDFSDNSASYMERLIIDETAKLLDADGIDYEDISVKINILENGGIDINKFTLNLKNKNDFAAIKEKVKQKIGIEPEVIVSGEDKNGYS